MIPIVFCASLPPWPKLKAAAENNWAIRDHLLIEAKGCLNRIQFAATLNTNPKIIPINGATAMNITVLYQPAAMITPKPLLAIAAPAYPPIKAWDELLGNPKYHVIRFQAIAPQTPARTTVGVTVVTSIIPLPIVLATVVPNIRKAMKLKNAAHMTACWGFNTLVETMVAIELAASCMPLVKSKAKAIAIIMIMNNRFESMFIVSYLSNRQTIIIYLSNYFKI
jgi:hypothetical protein